MSVIVREKPKGTGIFYVFINHQGKRKSKKIGRNKKLAQDVAKQIEARLVLGEYDLDEKPVQTFGQYAEKWITSVVPSTCKESTLKDYHAILKNHIFPRFQDMPITEINRLAIKEFLLEKGNSGLSRSKTGHIRACMSGVFNLALDDDVISANPAHNLRKIYGRADTDRSKKIDPLSREELALLLDTFQKHFPKYYPLVLTLARTGMRLGEALGLQWGDIDFTGRFITVQRSISRGKIGTPKNHKSRKADMSLQLTETLWKLKRERDREYQENTPEWVFISSTGTHVDEYNFRGRIFYTALEKAELRRIRIHDIRHTCASILLQDGVSMMYVSKLLGHSSIKITVDTYGHLLPDGNKDIVDSLDDSFAVQCSHVHLGADRVQIDAKK